MSESIEENKIYKVYKITSSNTNYYYVDYTKNRGYLSMVIHGLLLRYKKNGNNPEKYCNWFYVLSKGDIKIEELNTFDNYSETEEYLKTFYDDENCINMKKPSDYVFVKDVSCIKDKVDKQQYLKNYYSSNKDRYKERYQEKREMILKKKKDTYVSKKKKNIDEKKEMLEKLNQIHPVDLFEMIGATVIEDENGDGK